MRHCEGAGSAIVFNIQRLSTHDGPGYRTAVFLKGCPLRCAWCHNPESFDSEPLVWLDSRKCLHCGRCAEACSSKAATFRDGFPEFDRSRCLHCGRCVAFCAGGALEMAGEEYSAERLFAEVMKDEDFYRESNGGVTVSGGEPAMRPAFVKRLLGLCKRHGVHTAVDTCGFAPFDAYEAMLPYTDLLLYDIKTLDDAKHRAFTGKSNEIILRNLLRLRDLHADGGLPAALWVRTPLIPGMTAALECLLKIGEFMAENLAGFASRWELCQFNPLCAAKYRKLGVAWPLAGEKPLSKEELRVFRDELGRSFSGLCEIRFSGLESAGLGQS